MSKIFVSSSNAGSGRFFKAIYGMVSSPGLVLFLSDFRAFVVSSLVMFLEYSSDGATKALRGVRCSLMVSAQSSTSALCSWLKYISGWVRWTLASWAAKVSAVSLSELVLELVAGLMSFIGFLSGLVCPVRLLIVLQYCRLSLGFKASTSLIWAAFFASSSRVFISFVIFRYACLSGS